MFLGLVDCTLLGDRTVEIAYWIAADSQIESLFYQRLASFTLAQKRITDELYEQARTNLLGKVRDALFNILFKDKDKRKPPAS